jgi:hypothetical protein
MYLKVELVPEAPGVPFHHWTLRWSGLFDVAEVIRCSRDDRREVVGMILMFTW